MYLKKVVIAVCLFVSIISIGQESKTISLNGDWSFKIDPEYQGEGLGFEKKDFDSSHWDKMEVPGNWNLHNLYSEYSGDAWYTTTFKIDQSAKDQLVRLLFESVYNDCKVWLNGKLIGENHFGFLPFEFDVSNKLVYDQENRITVLVNNMFKKGAIWNWGGIRRPVALQITNPIRIDYQHITAIPDLKKGSASVEVKIASSNTTSIEKSVSYLVYLKRAGKVVAKKEITCTLKPNTTEQITLCDIPLAKDKVTLWHYDFPVLYESVIELIDANKTVHLISNKFGIRKVEMEGNTILLNGVSIRPIGFNVVAEDRITGTTLPFEKVKADVDMMKSLGSVMARLSHFNLHEEYLDYLDEKGILIISEVSLWGKDRWVDPDHPMPKEWLQRIIKKEYNHPSIIAWSVGNEIGDKNSNPKNQEYVKGAIAMAKSLDKNRFSVYVSHTAPSQEDDAVKYSDIAMINLYGGYNKAVQTTWKHHKKPIFVSEFNDNLNSEDPNLGVVKIKQMLDAMRNKEYVFGASLWTFNDYRSKYVSSPAWTTPLSQNRSWGIVTGFGQPKRGYYETQREFAPVKQLFLSDIDLERGFFKININPRVKLDLPANVLKGFKVTWSIIDNSFKDVKSGEKALQTIYPGDNLFSIPVKLALRTVNGLKIELVDPQGYIVLNQIKYFLKPPQPRIKHVNASSDGIRFIFDKVAGADEYAIQYKYNDSTFISDKTINGFIEINKNIKQNQKVSCKLIAYNSVGQSDPSDELVVAKNESDLPPVIWEAIRNNTSIFISFTVLPKDDMYEVEYGFNSMDYTKKLAFKNQGVVRLSDLPKDKAVFFRMRTRKQTGFASDWTHEIKIN
jgi:beta-galactosidase